MAAIANQFMGKVFVGSPADVGTFANRYDGWLAEGERVEREFRGMRDGMVLTTHRMIVINSQGIMGKKVEMTSFPWKAITAFALENSGTLDLEAELKIAGSGWGVCEVMFTKGTNVREVSQYLNAKIIER